MTYFEFYQIPISFQVDKAALKRQFYALSKKYHPDFYTLASEEEQAKALDLSTLNNKAYKVLSDFDARMKYILELHNILAAEGQNKLPQSFLMEMMDLNETLMELEFEFDENQFQKSVEAIKQFEEQLDQSVEALLPQSIGEMSPESLNKIKEYYLKRRYLLRIRKNLDRFASP